jgi:ABC-type branched-subunit amino acid transport system substrate-binding protein
MIKDQGGINGRQIKFISRDDSYSPPKTVDHLEDHTVMQAGLL